MNWKLFLTALGLALIIEGLPYLIYPKGVKEMAIRLSNFSQGILQVIGLTGIGFGLLLIYLGRLLL